MKFQNVRDLSGNVADYSLGLHSRRSRHDRRSCPVCVAVVVRQWRGSKHFCKHDVPSQLQRYLSTAAVLHGRRTHAHTVDRGTYVQRMCDQGRGALIRMGGAPLVQNRSLLFIRPPLFLAILA